eukprot:1159972-Pelagomonas_calceolata.AAC.12
MPACVLFLPSSLTGPLPSLRAVSPLWTQAPCDAFGAGAAAGAAADGAAAPFAWLSCFERGKGKAKGVPSCALWEEWPVPNAVAGASAPRGARPLLSLLRCCCCCFCCCWRVGAQEGGGCRVVWAVGAGVLGTT